MNLKFPLFFFLICSKIFALDAAIIILGQPGSGKGTQAQVLSEKLHWPILAPANLKREFIAETASETQVHSLKIHPQIENIFKIGLVLNELPKRANNYAIFENWPDNHEAIDVLSMLVDKKNLLVVELVVTDNEVPLARIGHRKQCSYCGISYGLARQELQRDICDSCQAPIVARKNDNRSYYLDCRLPHFYARQKTYQEAFHAHGIPIYSIEAVANPETIHARILEHLQPIAENFKFRIAESKRDL